MSINITEEQLQNLIKAAVSAAAGVSGGNASGTDRPRVKNPERPEIDLGYSETQWAFFLDEWQVYKRRAALKNENLTDELRASCSKDLRKTLFDFVGSATLATLTEAALLEKIKSAAVIGKNKAVHRKEFYEIQQAPDEPIHRLVAKLRAKAERCNFTQRCSAAECGQMNSYADEMVCDQMTYGLYDKDIQQEVLAKDKTLANFEETYALVEAYELGKQAKAQLDKSSNSEVNAFRSQYRAQQEQRRKDNGLKQICTGCGTTKHSGKQREEECEAWGKKCENCGKFNHLEQVCLHERKEKQENGSKKADEPKSIMKRRMQHNDDDDEPSRNAAAAWEDKENVSWFLAFGMGIDDRCEIPHIEWDGKDFVKANLSPFPSLNVRITPLLNYHERFLSAKCPAVSNPAYFEAFADTCAQTCVAGEKLLQSVNVPRQWLIPTNHRIVGFTEQSLDICGTLLAKIECGGNATYTAIYISSSVDALYLSRKVQSGLGILPDDYPSVFDSSALIHQQTPDAPDTDMRVTDPTDCTTVTQNQNANKILADPAILECGPVIGFARKNKTENFSAYVESTENRKIRRCGDGRDIKPRFNQRTRPRRMTQTHHDNRTTIESNDPVCNKSTVVYSRDKADATTIRFDELSNCYVPRDTPLPNSAGRSSDKPAWQWSYSNTGCM